MNITIPYRPRPLQLQLHKNVKQNSVILTHRQFGKTVFAVNHLIKDACINTQRAARYAYIAPYRNQAKAIAFDYLKYYTRAIPGVSTNESELRVDLPNDSRINLYGADNENALRGIYLDGVVLDEYAQISPKLFGEVISPTLSSRDGWTIFMGTPNGMNHFYDLWKMAQSDPEWYTAMFKASDTGILSQKYLDAARKVMTEEQYAQELECSFTASAAGAYYAKQMQEAYADGRVTKVDWVPSLPVYTFWDLGMADSTSIWFVQKAGSEVHIIDFYENDGVGIEHYIGILATKPYIYGINAGHWAPHDIEVRELGTGKSRLEVARSLGLPFNIVPNIGVQDGINAARSLLYKCWFDRKNCDKGIKALETYQKVWDAKGDIWKERPLHNWASHGADAFRYMAVAIDRCATDEEIGWNKLQIVPDIGIV
jgi:hypothetical protein